MQSTMMHVPLSIRRILEYGATVHGTTTISTSRDGSIETVTFTEMAHRAAACAHALREDIGITGDERVGTFMYNCCEHIEVMFAVSCMSAVFTPLNRMLQIDQVAHVINHAEISVIIADPSLVPRLARILPHTPCVKHVILIGAGDLADALAGLPATVHGWRYESLLNSKPTVFDWPDVEEDTAAALCYSSGSTDGPPKGVLYSHRSIYLHSLSLRTTDSFAIGHGRAFLCCVPIYHVLSWGVPFAALMSGAPLVLPGSDLTPETLASIIAQTHPRVATGVPTLWIALMVHYMHHPPERMSLREIISGGSPVPESLIKVWEERYGVDVIHIWGMTETSPIGTVARPPRGAGGEQRWHYRTSQGRFPASLEYRVVGDSDEKMKRSDRIEGEIQVRGPWVTGAYYHSDAVSEFRGAPFTDAPESFTDDGWLKTGDVGSVTSDGYLQIEDRARDVIRSGGEWIYSVQLENLITNHPDVVAAAVIGYPDSKWGQRPMSVTVLHEDVPPTAETAENLRGFLREFLPSWMLPEYWTFVSRIDETSVGKYDKKDLRQHLANGEFEVIALKGPGRV
ncbi:MAG: long-chain fatty-acid--CoA ligase [Corynebacterium sp.]|nr:long-chain fatty-acid--CoA ligase [Corynebacterium sp.]